MNYKDLDQKALQAAKEFRKTEAVLLSLIMKVDRYKVFRKFGYNSLYQYVSKRLKVSDSQTYAFISVARKSHEVPKLQQSIAKGEISLNKAKRITAVINKDNQDQWLQMATEKTQRMLEREVALAQPEKAIQEKSTYLSSNEALCEKVQVKKNTLKIKLEIGLPEETMLKLRRAQDLVSQKRRESVNLASTIETLVEDFIKRQDPVEKAKRQKIRGKLKINAPSKTKPFSRNEKNESPQRKALPASIKHQVFLRDQGQCTSMTPEGSRCPSRRFLEVHHIKPVSNGGENSLENLTLLCSGHHAFLHQK